MKFTVERGGGSSDMRVAGQVRQPAQEWEPEWQYAVKRAPLTYFAASIWEGEIAIPWTSLEMPPPKPGTTIPFQFTRYAGNIQRTAELNQRVSTWAPVSNLWHVIVPETFGELILRANIRFLRKYGKFMEGKQVCQVSSVNQLQMLVRGRSGICRSISMSWHAVAKLPSLDQRYSWLPQLDVTPYDERQFSDRHGKLVEGNFTRPARFQVEAVPRRGRASSIIGNLSKRISGKVRIHCRLRRKTEMNWKCSKSVCKRAPVFGIYQTNPHRHFGKSIVQLFGREGRMQHYETDIKTCRVDWMNQNIGAVNGPAWWEIPVIRKQEQRLDFHILDNRYGFTTISFPQQVDLRGAPFSDGAMTSISRQRLAESKLAPFR